MLPRFYPIVPDAGWVRRIVPHGVKLIQLRIKGVPRAEIAHAIRQALQVCEEHGCELAVND